jgi:hypothetical protein
VARLEPVALVLAAPLVFTSSLSQAMRSQMGVIIVCRHNMLLAGRHAQFRPWCIQAWDRFWPSRSTWSKGDYRCQWPGAHCRGLAGMLFAVLSAGSLKAATPFAVITLASANSLGHALMFPNSRQEGGVSAARDRAFAVGDHIQTSDPAAYLIAAHLHLRGADVPFTRTPLGRMLNAVRDGGSASIRRLRHAECVTSLIIAVFGHLRRPGCVELPSSRPVVSGPRSRAYLLFGSSAARHSSSAPSSVPS